MQTALPFERKIKTAVAVVKNNPTVSTADSIVDNSLKFARWPQMSACNGADILMDGKRIGWMGENESGLWIIGLEGHPSETRASYESACKRVREMVAQ